VWSGYDLVASMDRASSLGTFPQLLSPRHEQRFTPFAFFSSKSLVAASSQVTYKKMADAPTLDDHVVPPIAFNATNRNSSNAHEQHPPPYPNQDHALAPYDAIVPRQSDDELALIRVLAFVGRKDLEIHELRSRVASLEEELEIMEVEQLCSILEDSDTQSVEEDESSDAETIKACRVPSSPAASSPSTVPPSVASQKYAPRGRTARARQASEWITMTCECHDEAPSLMHECSRATGEPSPVTVRV
jgi:hypothetical protein